MCWYHLNVSLINIIICVPFYLIWWLGLERERSFAKIVHNRIDAVKIPFENGQHHLLISALINWLVIYHYLSYIVHIWTFYLFACSCCSAQMQFPWSSLTLPWLSIRSSNIWVEIPLPIYLWLLCGVAGCIFFCFVYTNVFRISSELLRKFWTKKLWHIKYVSLHLVTQLSWLWISRANKCSRESESHFQVSNPNDTKCWQYNLIAFILMDIMHWWCGWR